MRRHYDVPVEWYGTIDKDIARSYPERLRGHYSDDIAREARHATWVSQMNDVFWSRYVQKKL